MSFAPQQQNMEKLAVSFLEKRIKKHWFWLKEESPEQVTKFVVTVIKYLEEKERIERIKK